MTNLTLVYHTECSCETELDDKEGILRLMGAENSVLEGCEWGEPLSVPPVLPWQLTPVTKPDGSVVTVFGPKQTDKKDNDLLKKAAVVSSIAGFC